MPAIYLLAYKTKDRRVGIVKIQYLWFPSFLLKTCKRLLVLSFNTEYACYASANFFSSAPALTCRC
jgi:hypothetical protein